MRTAIQAVEGLRHVQHDDVELEEAIGNDKEEETDIMCARHYTASIER